MSAASACDLAVVGAGSAGFSAAIAAAEKGARVLLVGFGTIGGTCVNVGCVPSKFLIRAAEAVHAGSRAHRFRGVRGALELADWPALRARMEELVATLRREKYESVLEAWPQIRYVEGRARLVPGGVEVAGTTYRVPKVVLATGSRPAILPGLEVDGERIVTSTELLRIARIPHHLVVVGGGYVGLELGQAFRRFGARVSVVEWLDRILPGSDPDLAAELQRHLTAEGIDFLLAHRVARAERRDGGIELEVAPREGGPARRLQADVVLVAVGRRPNTEELGLAEVGVETDARGFVRTDAHMRTSNPDVYAAGDVTGRFMLVYVAAATGRIAALNALEGDRHVFDDSLIPRVVFTDPQLAEVGLSAGEARAQGLEVEVRDLPLDQLPRALAAQDTRGLVRLVAQAKSRRLLGAGIVAPEGADSIQTAAMALRQGLDAGTLARELFPYLTTVEGLKLAAQLFEKDVRQLSCCAG